MSETITIDADGGITEQTITSRKVTVGFTRKTKAPNDSYQYATAEWSAHIEAPIAPNATEEDVLTAIDQTVELARTTVNTQLGLNEGGGAAALKAMGATEVETTPASASKPSKGKANPDSLWADLLANPHQWWDNREDKKNPRAPDFKKAGTGDGLWLNTREGKPAVDESQLAGLTFKNG